MHSLLACLPEMLLFIRYFALGIAVENPQPCVGMWEARRGFAAESPGRRQRPNSSDYLSIYNFIAIHPTTQQ